MNSVNNYKRRFFNLLESQMGDVKPLITETTTNAPTDYYEIVKFQNWVKQTKKFDLGAGGPNNDGVDGQMGPKTKDAWNKYGQEYLNFNKSDKSSGENFVDSTKSTINRMLDSGEYDYNYIENRISAEDAANLLDQILENEDDNLLYNLPEAVIEAIFIRIKNSNDCDFFQSFLRNFSGGSIFFRNYDTKDGHFYYDYAIATLKRKLPMDINKKYHKESISSILAFIINKCGEK